MDVDVHPRGDQGDELRAGEGAPVDAGQGPYQGGCRDAVPPGICQRQETREETQAGEGGGGMTRTTLVVDMEGRARPIPPANQTSFALASSVSLAETTRKQRVWQCVNSVIINLFIIDSFHLMKCS
jgi:hypothetical protein